MERMQVLVDTSENTPPRGFPEFDKLQLDPVRREYMKKLRIKMLNHNEEYLAKHPQVEAILRLIVMEVLCHKPFDVRKFIKELLKSPNLETRVAKVILSKRINLERNHTREYYTHVAEWEQKADTNYDYKLCDDQEWPEPRPARTETRRDKPEYSHLHYFKEPYWLYPKEFMKVANESEVMRTSSITKLPEWMSEFLKADFFQKWGPISTPKQKDNNKKRKKRRICIKPKHKHIKRRTKKKATEKLEPENDTLKNKSYCTTYVGKSDYSAENRSLILQCPTCRISVAGLHPEMDNVERLLTLRSNNSKRSSSMCRPPRLSVEEVVSEVEENLGRAEGLQVHRDGMRLADERGRPLEEVSAILSQATRTYESGSIFKNWEFKFSGNEISFAIPSEELKEKSPEEQNKTNGIHALDKEVPRKYKSPVFQVVINKS